MTRTGFSNRNVFSPLDFTKVDHAKGRCKQHSLLGASDITKLDACAQLIIAVHNSAYLERPDCRVKGHARLGKEWEKVEVGDT